MAAHLAPHLRKPGGSFWGWLALRLTTQRLQPMNRWALQLLAIQPSDRILELGFGAGISIARAAQQAPDGFIAGVDHSEQAVREATRRNRAAIRAGRVALHQGDAAQVPYEDNTFDKAFSCALIYYLPDIDAALREALRVLKRGGSYTILGRTAEALMKVPAFSRNPHTLYTADELVTLLLAAGFARAYALSDPPEATLIGAVGVK